MDNEEIKEIRKLLCVTQEKMAQLLGTTVATVCRWESGRVRPSRLYVKELKELKAKHGSYLCRREKLKDA